MASTNRFPFHQHTRRGRALTPSMPLSSFNDHLPNLQELRRILPFVLANAGVEQLRERSNASHALRCDAKPAIMCAFLFQGDHAPALQSAQSQIKNIFTHARNEFYQISVCEIWE